MNTDYYGVAVFNKGKSGSIGEKLYNTLAGLYDKDVILELDDDSGNPWLPQIFVGSIDASYLRFFRIRMTNLVQNQTDGNFMISFDSEDETGYSFFNEVCEVLGLSCTIMSYSASSSWSEMTPICPTMKKVNTSFLRDVESFDRVNYVDESCVNGVTPLDLR